MTWELGWVLVLIAAGRIAPCLGEGLTAVLLISTEVA
jgi:hypothetical protein